jgi:hypothetical protein
VDRVFGLQRLVGAPQFDRMWRSLATARAVSGLVASPTLYTGDAIANRTEKHVKALKGKRDIFLLFSFGHDVYSGPDENNVAGTRFLSSGL